MNVQGHAKTDNWPLMADPWLKIKEAMDSKRRGIFIGRQLSAASRQEFFPEHSTEKRCIQLNMHGSSAGSFNRAFDGLIQQYLGIV